MHDLSYVSLTCSTEDEQKYVLKDIPWDLLESPDTLKIPIDQYYLISEIPKVTERVRKYGESYIYTRKTPIEGSSANTEEERFVTQQEFDHFVARSVSQLSKTRFIVPFGGYRIEIDIFRSTPLRWLAFAEVEFSELSPRETFLPPAWMGEAIVSKEFSNKRLSRLQAFPAGILSHTIIWEKVE